MSVIHVNQIRNQVERLFTGLVDLRDVEKASPEMKEAFFLTRGLAAYAIHYLSGVEPKEAALAVTDAGDDNGLDAILFHEQNKRLYLVQSKWIKNGSGEPENGEIKKFVAGVRDLFNLRFDRFNKHIKAKQSIVSQALNDPATRYEIVVAHTGASRLAEPSQRDLADLAEEMNDVSEVLYTTILHQGDLHASLTAGISGEPINLQIGLKSWGRKESPHEAFYGQVSADQILEWWKSYKQRLFARNLRSMLGETDVNTEMRTTVEKEPALFWYFNNGVTIVTRRASRAMVGGGGNDFATFHCEDISIVNGAQTVGTIGKFGETNPESLADVFVPLRVIVRGENQSFGEDVTRTNNRQNRIEGRDFVALDPEQTRIRTELAIDGIDYQLMRSETIVRGDSAFDLVEATTALACASKTVRLPVQLKREIGRLWDDIGKAPYKELFNARVAGLHVWRCVQTQRLIDRMLDKYLKQPGRESDYGIVTHGNRIIAALVFEALPVAKFEDPTFDFDVVITDSKIDSLVDERAQLIASLMEVHYPNSIIPTLFKNLKKCEHLVEESRSRLSSREGTS